nr:hypothetical protein [Pseudoalteromonas sp. APC 3893]
MYKNFFAPEKESNIITAKAVGVNSITHMIKPIDVPYCEVNGQDETTSNAIAPNCKL